MRQESTLSEIRHSPPHKMRHDLYGFICHPSHYGNTLIHLSLVIWTQAALAKLERSIAVDADQPRRCNSSRDLVLLKLWLRLDPDELIMAVHGLILLD